MSHTTFKNGNTEVTMHPVSLPSGEPSKKIVVDTTVAAVVKSSTPITFKNPA